MVSGVEEVSREGRCHIGEVPRAKVASKVGSSDIDKFGCDGMASAWWWEGLAEVAGRRDGISNECASAWRWSGVGAAWWEGRRCWSFNWTDDL